VKIGGGKKQKNALKGRFKIFIDLAILPA